MYNQNNYSKLRIIGGALKRRKVTFNSKILNLRPTLERVRETTFNWLAFDLLGANCLDLFAGSGIFGFEAISRGANVVCAVENNPIIIPDLVNNQQRLHISNDNFMIINQDVRIFLQHNYSTNLDLGIKFNQKFNIVFLDPPYQSKDLLLNSLHLLASSKLLSSHSKIYFECTKEPWILNDPAFPHQDYQVLKYNTTSSIAFYLLQKIG